MSKSPKSKSQTKNKKTDAATLREFRSQVAKLKKLGAVSKKVDARSQKFTRYMRAKIKSHAWLFDPSKYTKTRVKSAKQAKQIVAETGSPNAYKAVGNNVYLITSRKTKLHSPLVNNMSVRNGKVSFKHAEDGKRYYKVKAGLVVRPKGYSWVLMENGRYPVEFEYFSLLRARLQEDSRRTMTNDMLRGMVFLVKSSSAAPYDPNDYTWFGHPDDPTQAEAIAEWLDSDEYKEALR